jgi:hypothetical protein
MAGGAALGLVALGGCDLGDLDPRQDDSSPGPGEEQAGDVDADQGVVDDVVAELGRVAATLAATRVRFPRLRARIASLRALHVAHLEALDATAEGIDAGPVRAGSASAALVEIRVLESRLQRRLADWSVAARSGALARLLASMSAAVAQELAAQAGAASAEGAS